MTKVVRAETISKHAEAKAVHAKIFDNGTAEFAVVKLRLDPLPEANAVLFVDNPALDLPREYLSGIEDGIYEAARDGVLNGGRVVDVRVTLLDARYHALDSSARTFRLAAVAAFRDAMRSADPVLVNPAGS